MSTNSPKPQVLTLNGGTELERIVQAFVTDKRALNLADGSIHFYDVKLRTFLNYCNTRSVSKIEDITPTLIREFLLHLKETNHNDGGVFSYHKALKSLLLWYEYEYEPDHWRNPIRRVATPRISVEPIKGIPLENYHLMLDQCPRGTLNGERDRTILMVLIETGVRATELLNIDIGDVDLSDNSILIRKGKGRKPRSVFFGKTARKQLRIYLKLRQTNRGPLIVTPQSERLTFYGLQEVMRRLSEKANVDCPGLHDFRRTFCLECLKNKIDIQTLARLMGHSSLKTLSRYLSQTKEDIGAAYKSIID